MNNKIRIIGGRWRGRQLLVLNSPKLRPTPNRVRETLFNWLAMSIVNAKCFDCFAGSGALGIESLSRYAASATFLEVEHSVVQNIWKNLDMLKTSNAKVINTNTLSYLEKTGTPHDVVFIDPPFYQGLLEKTIHLLESNGWLFPNALIYVESEAKSNPLKIPSCWNLHREKTAGRVAYRLYHRKVKNG